MTISAKIIADSISSDNIRLVTLQLRYPKFVHNELLTHRVFSRSSSSSRAIPVERLIKDVIDDPVFPLFWGKNQKGMQADEECNENLECEDIAHTREEGWDGARIAAIYWANVFTKAGYHKQIVNRLLEPFCHINTVVTATEWDNFFSLRCHPDAQPEMRLLAEPIREAINNSIPAKLNSGEWHIPYVADPTTYGWDWAVKISVARCARVSYLTQEGKPPNFEEDLKLYDRLVGAVPKHFSPAEHQATPDKNIGNEVDGDVWQRANLHGNFHGWVQYRKLIE